MSGTLRASSHAAGLGPRCAAFLWDYVILAGYVSLLVALGLLLQRSGPEWIASRFSGPWTGELMGFMTLTLPVSLYFALCESSPAQATWGKRKRRLRVVDVAGARIGFARAWSRTLLKLVPWELTHALIWQARFTDGEPPGWFTGGLVLVWLLIGANALAIWSSASHQALHDRGAGTLVVRATPGP